MLITLRVLFVIAHKCNKEKHKKKTTRIRCVPIPGNMREILEYHKQQSKHIHPSIRRRALLYILYSVYASPPPQIVAVAHNLHAPPNKHTHTHAHCALHRETHVDIDDM